MKQPHNNYFPRNRNRHNTLSGNSLFTKTVSTRNPEPVQRDEQTVKISMQKHEVSVLQPIL